MGVKGVWARKPPSWNWEIFPYSTYIRSLDLILYGTYTYVYRKCGPKASSDMGIFLNDLGMNEKEHGYVSHLLYFKHINVVWLSSY